MSKLKKLLATGLLVVVSCFSYLGGAVANIAKSLFSVGSASAASFNGGNVGASGAVKQGNILSVSKIATEIAMEESVTIDFGGTNKNVTAKTATGTDVALTKANLFIEVLDPYGASLTKYEDGEMKVVDNSQITLTETALTLSNPKTSGEYEVRLHTKSADGIWTSTSSYYISVSCVSYELKLATNDSIIMPYSFKTGDSANESLNIALPLVYDENGELVENTDILLNDNYVVNYKELTNVKLSDVMSSSIKGIPTDNTYAKYKTYTIRKLAEGEVFSGEYKLNVTIGGATIDFSSVTTETKNYDTVAPSFKVNDGKNVINYALSKSSREVAKYSHTVSGSTQYESDKIELTATPASKLDSFAYKERVYLPKITAVNANNKEENLPYFYYYVIKEKVGEVYSVTDNVVMGKDEKGFYFEPQGDVGTFYNLYYNAVDAFGHSATASDYTKKVTDAKLDNYAITGSYLAEKFGKEEYLDEMNDQTYKMPSKLLVKDGVTTKITLPAVWAYDKSGIKQVWRSLSSDSSTLISTSSSNETEKKSGTFYLTSDSAKTTEPSNIEMPGKTFDTEGKIETRYSLADFVTFKAVLKDGGSTKNVEVYEVKSERDSIGDLRIRTTNGVNADDDKYLYYYDTASQSFYLSIDGTKKPETDTKVSVTDIRNFKNSCDVELELSSKLFGAGTYTISYFVQDASAISGEVRKEFTFDVVTESLEETKPTVTFGDNNVSNVGKGQKFSVKVPTIKDTTDTKLLVKYYAVAGDQVKLLSSGLSSAVTKIEVDMSMEMGSSTLYDLAKEGKSFKIVALAFNHFADSSLEYTSLFTESAGVGLGEVTITVKNSDDSVAPKIDTIGATTGIPEQNVEFTVGGVTFLDNSSDARVLVEITDTDGKVYTDWSSNGGLVIEKLASPDAEGNTHKYTFGGVKFTPTNADSDKYYTVTYKLVDKCDNVTAYSFVLAHVTDKTPPVINLDSTEKRTVELGSSLEITFEAKDNSGIKANTVVCKDTDDKEYNLAFVEGNRIKFEGSRVGTYTLILTSIDNNDNKSTREFTVEVKDTLKPVISVLSESGTELKFNETTNELELPSISESAMYEDEAKTTPATITIPRATIKDIKPENALNTVDFGAAGRLTITTPNKDDDGRSEFVYDFNGNLVDSSVTNSLGLVVNGNTFEFKPFGKSFRGEYKVVYSGTDNSGLSATSKTITISVGDTVKPEIFLTSSFETKLTNGFVLDGENNILTFNANAKIKGKAENYASEDLYVADNIGFDVEDNIDYIKVNVYITDPSGNILDAESDTTTTKTTYKFTKAGTYTMTFSVTDATGTNKQTITRKFVVKAKSSSSVDSATIIGTVLIVVSALILAGIIIYLVRGVKLLPKKNKKASKKNDKKSD